jgi:hypothetical protein
VGAWLKDLPDDLVEQFAIASGGMFGEYDGFDWQREDTVRATLEASGHKVVTEGDV